MRWTYKCDSRIFPGHDIRSVTFEFTEIRDYKGERCAYITGIASGTTDQGKPASLTSGLYFSLERQIPVFAALDMVGPACSVSIRASLVDFVAAGDH